MRSNSAQSTENVLRGILKKYHLEDDVYLQEIFNNWHEIVGADLAKICEPIDIKNGILVLKTKNNLWRQELGKKQKELLNSVKTKVKVCEISYIEFI